YNRFKPLADVRVLLGVLPNPNPSSLPELSYPESALKDLLSQIFALKDSILANNGRIVQLLAKYVTRATADPVGHLALLKPCLIGTASTAVERCLSKPHLSAEDLLSCWRLLLRHGLQRRLPRGRWTTGRAKAWSRAASTAPRTAASPIRCRTASTTPPESTSPAPGFTDTQCTKQCIQRYNSTYQQDKHFGASAYSVRSNEQQIMTEIMTNGPVEGAFTVYADFPSYKSGVYQHHTEGGSLGGHAIRILAAGRADGGTPYWLVANSWNSDWGERGFFRILRGKDECGIESSVVAGLPKD
uniref:Pept_C1 domain-containing protein n=1 Tax=Macrostomum lignano TaxID=282301 RepID=A0A1I8FPY3_9PLAT